MSKRLLATTLILATLLAGPQSLAGGKADWSGYGWTSLDTGKCVSGGATLACPAITQKWDWKRNQWVSIELAVSGQSLTLTQRLDNNDRSDRDDVCVTVLLTDEAGETVFAHHQNWDSLAASTMQEQFTYDFADWTSVRSIEVGSKQCRQGPHQDDAIFAGVVARLAR